MLAYSSPPNTSHPSSLSSSAVLLPVTVTIVSNTSNAIHLSWSQPSASNVQGFIILSAIKALLPPSSLSSPINTSLFTSTHLPGYHLEWTVDGLESGVTYIFLVLYTVASSGSMSEPSRAVQATTQTSGCGVFVCPYAVCAISHMYWGAV